MDEIKKNAEEPGNYLDRIAFEYKRPTIKEIAEMRYLTSASILMSVLFAVVGLKRWESVPVAPVHILFVLCFLLLMVSLAGSIFLRRK